MLILAKIFAYSLVILISASQKSAFKKNMDAETVDGEETVKRAVISTEILTEFKTFRQLLVKRPRDTTASQLKELVSSDMLKASQFAQDGINWLDDSSFYRFCGEELLANETDKDLFA